MISIDIKSLKPGVHEFEWGSEAEALGLDPQVFRELRVNARLDFHLSRIFITLHTQANVRLTCDRTLVEFDQSVEGKHDVTFTSADLTDEMEEQDDDVRVLGTSDEEIDITDVVRDTFILSVPARKVAPGADIEEIPLAFGMPKPDGFVVDSRWEALRKLSSLGNDSEDEQ